MPIESELKTEDQKNLARLGDIIVVALYEVDLDIILHGGTALWRCYGGNRFSSDIDIYVTKSQLTKLNHYLTWSLNKRGVKINFPKYSSGRTMIIFDEVAKAKLEPMDKPAGLQAISMEYEKIDGTRLFVRTLKVDEFIKEKIKAYERRRYIRDLYDLYLLAGTEGFEKGVKSQLAKFIKRIEPPIDESVLQSMIYTGIAPTFNELVEKIGERIK